MLESVLLLSLLASWPSAVFDGIGSMFAASGSQPTNRIPAASRGGWPSQPTPPLELQESQNQQEEER
jgi:hypothetical protein